MMARVICLALVIAVVSCKTYRTTNKNCCPPLKYQGMMTIESALNVGPDINKKFVGPVAVDQVAMKVASLLNGTLETELLFIKRIQDYKNKVDYVAHPDTKTCEKYHMEQPLYGACIPDSLHPVGNAHLGAGSETLDVMSYAGTITFEKGTFINNVTVTKGNCVPVSSILKDGGSYDLTVFYNIIEEIKDPSLFDVPSYCNQAPFAEAGNRPLSHVWQQLGKAPLI